ncbi:hypothetical protein [Secundilactobacillus collinoides]|nr:hypothetical protein [Secundilactobacillus collinoides]KZL35680.1 hypothetical protein TY91_15925 [Secundilactobacillus collinoides]
MENTNTTHNERRLATIAATAMMLSSAFFGVVATNDSAQASSKAAKIRYYQNIKNAYYTYNSSKSGKMYTSSYLTNVKKTVKKSSTKLYATYAAHVTRRDGVKAIYYRISTTKGKTIGWLWKGYLKKATTSSTSSRSPLDTSTTSVGLDGSIEKAPAGMQFGYGGGATAPGQAEAPILRK